MNKRKNNFPKLVNCLQSNDIRGKFCKIFNDKIIKKFYKSPKIKCVTFIPKIKINNI